MVPVAAGEARGRPLAGGPARRGSAPRRALQSAGAARGSLRPSPRSRACRAGGRNPHGEAMATADVIVVGGGISGLAFAWKAGQAGRKVQVLERDGRIGGRLYSHRRPDGYWFEMGAHSVYNSYGAFLDIAV